MVRKMISLFLAVIFLTGAAPRLLMNVYAEEDEITINTKSPYYHELSGTWYDSGLNDADGSKTRYSGDGQAEWRPELSAGTYVVSVYKLANSGSDSAAKLEVFFDGGSEQKEIDYTSGSSEWVPLGSYKFAAGTGGAVRISRGAGTVRCGSVKFEPVDTAAIEAADSAVHFIDIDYSQYKDSIELVAHIGLMNGEDKNEFGPDLNMTRAELASLVARNILKQNYAVTEALPRDVASSHWAAGDICFVKEYGYMVGYADGSFGPEDSVTYNQVVKTLVSALGYDSMAENKGAKYPESWLLAAEEIKLTKGTEAGGENEIRRDLVAKLLDNALTIKIPEIVHDSSSSYYSTKDADTLLEKLGYQKIKGRITANDCTSLTDKNELPKGKFEINGVVYQEGYTNAGDYIGQQIELYATKSEDDQEETAVYFRTDGDTKVTTIDPEDLISVNDSSITYYTSEHYRRNIRLNQYACVIFNGKLKLAWTEADFRPECGEIKVISSSSGADTIIINSFKNLMIADVDPTYKKIYFADKTVLNTEEYSIAEITDIYGKTVKLSEIQSDSIASVAKSEDESILHIIVSSSSVTGEVDKRTGDTLTVNGIEYKIANNLINDTTMVYLTAGDTKTFLIDFQGKIAGIKGNSRTNDSYGYLIDMRSDDGESYGTKFKIIDAQGNARSYFSAKKIAVDGVGYTNETVYNSAELLDGGTLKRQLILYKLNENKEVMRIYTPQDLTGGQQKDNSCRLAKEAEMSSAIFRGGKQMSFASRYFVNNSVLIFCVPKDSALAADEKAYGVKGISFLNENGDKNYTNMDFYNVDENLTAEVIVYKTDIKNNVGNHADVAVVKNTMEIVNQYNDIVPAISAYVGGQETTLHFDDTDIPCLMKNYAISDPASDLAAEAGALPESITPDQLKPGDVIQYELNNHGNIDKARVLFRANSPEQREYVNAATGVEAPSETADAYGAIYYAVGVVTEKFDGGFMYTVTTSAGEKERAIKMDGASFFTLSGSGGGNMDICAAKLGDVVIGDSVFIRKDASDAKEVLIIKQ